MSPVVSSNAENSRLLMQAAQGGDLQAVQALLRDDLGVEAINQALYAAVVSEQQACFDWLLPLAQPALYHHAALVAAATLSQPYMLERLIPVSDPLVEGSRPLLLAAQAGLIKNVRLLLPHSDPKVRVGDALTVAVQKRHLDVVELLVADHKTRPPSAQNTLLFRAAMDGDLPLFQRLWPAFPRTGAREQALQNAAIFNQEPIVAAFFPMLDPNVQQGIIEIMEDLSQWKNIDLLLLYAADSVSQPWEDERADRVPRFRAKVQARERKAQLTLQTDSARTRPRPRS